jgi:integrase
MPRKQTAKTLTDRWVDRVRFEGGDTANGKPKDRDEYWDDVQPGLGLRVTPAGRKTWIVMYRIAGERQARRLTLKEYGEAAHQMTLVAARKAAKEAVDRAAAGEDPATEKQERKEAPTVAGLAKDFLEKYVVPRKRSARHDDSILRLHVIPKWGKRKAHDIKRRDVVELLDGMKEATPIRANRTLACVRKMFNWAIEYEILEVNPCAHVRAPSAEKRRTKVLSDGEMRAVWKALDTMGTAVADAIKLRLLTVQRGGEIDSMTWGDIDEDARLWTIPASVAKNGQEHRVPLTVPVMALLRKQRERPKPVRPVATPSSVGLPGGKPPDYVFPSRMIAGGHLSNVHVSMRTVRKQSGVEFVPHDLRRTASSLMASLGVDRIVISKILNHMETTVTGRHYELFAYDDQKRKALDLWAERLMGIVG